MEKDNKQKLRKAKTDHNEQVENTKQRLARENQLKLDREEERIRLKSKSGDE